MNAYFGLDSWWLINSGLSRKPKCMKIENREIYIKNKRPPTVLIKKNIYILSSRHALKNVRHVFFYWNLHFSLSQNEFLKFWPQHLCANLTLSDSFVPYASFRTYSTWITIRKIWKYLIKEKREKCKAGRICRESQKTWELEDDLGIFNRHFSKNERPFN